MSDGKLKISSKTLINSYKKILMKTNDDIIMNDLLEAVYNKSNRSRVDLRNNDYIVVYDEELNALYVYIADTEVDVERLKDDIISLTSCGKVVTLIVNDLGADIISKIISDLWLVSYRCVGVIAMALSSNVQCNNVYTLRKAVIEDKASILSNILDESGIIKESDLYTYAVNDVISKIKSNSYYVLTHNNIVLAQAYLFEYDDNIFIHGVLTNKNVRNKGIATNMISQLANEFVKDGKSIYLSVIEDNIAAKRTYGKVGFEQIGVSHCFYLTYLSIINKNLNTI